jgi:asparagine synthase (glutamine-hydrolysing)
MSGIVGLINFDGTPVDSSLLERMTHFMAFRGPDAQHIWIDGHVGFGHTLLRTTDESCHEQQPCSLDGEVWITADARIDDRENLINMLAEHGREARLDRPDVELILHAYHAWGERCVEHLLGDFAFAIWDVRQRRLFCARDHFGFKPFYYSRVADCLIVSNTLNCVRLHPAVSNELNDLAIADFLLFGENSDITTSAFADIKRLPPAHRLTGSEGSVRVDRYWTLPVDGQIRYRRPVEYSEHLKELLRRAVGDRLRTKRVGVFMTGGMDSSSVAAVARKLVPAGLEPLELRAFTVVYDRLIPDRERTYAGLVAQALDIPIHFQCADGDNLYEGWDRPELQTPEPSMGTFPIALFNITRLVAAHSRIVLTGQGADPAMLGSSTYTLELLKAGAWGRLAVDLWAALSRGYLPKVGLRARLRRWHSRLDPPSPLPAWVNRDLAARLDLATRWSQSHAELSVPHLHRPEACQCLAMSHWPFSFESVDPGVTRLPLERRHPFFDLRVLTYLLAIPPLPWCDNKEVLRAAMVGLLPESVRLRPKAPLAGDPIRELLRSNKSSWIDQFEPVEELNYYVDRRKIPPLLGETDRAAISTNLRPLSLNYWLLGRGDSSVRNHGILQLSEVINSDKREPVAIRQA